jgi:hypothetical protein
MEKYLLKLDPVFKNTNQLLTWDEFNTYADYSIKAKTLHVHTEWAINFHRSKYFQDNNIAEKYRKTVKDYDYKLHGEKYDKCADDIMYEIAELETDLNTTPINKVEEKMLEAMESFVKVFSLGMVHYRGEFQYLSRFGMCKMLHPQFKNNFEDYQDIIKIIKKYNKTGTLKLSKDKLRLRDTYHIITALLWGFTEVGLGEEILDGVDILLEFEHLCGEKKREDHFWLGVDDPKNSIRRRLSLLMIKSAILRSMGKDEEQITVLKEILNMHFSKRDHRPINYYVALNRLTEAALSLYKLQPTKENKNTVLEYYKSILSTNTYDRHECTRERALVTFEILKTFGHIE